MVETYEKRKASAMRFNISDTVLRDHPGIEELLWSIAVHSKEEDPDITLMGLYVQVRRSRKRTHWAGNAWPTEHTRCYRTKVPTVTVHPAGKITMSIGADCTQEDIIQLFSHELRHNGQFHRGRQRFGYMTCDPMPEEDIEPDCYEFEDTILTKMAYAVPKKYQGYSTRNELLPSN